LWRPSGEHNAVYFNANFKNKIYFLFLDLHLNFNFQGNSVQKTIINRIFGLTLALTISACGGGGGGSSGPIPSNETFQLRTAYVNYITETRSMPFTVSGTRAGANITGSGTATQGPLSFTTFELQQAQQKTTTVTGTITVNGVSDLLSSSSTTYVDANFNPLGSSGTDYTVVTGNASIPNTARVNDTGTWYSTIRYASSTKAVRRGTGTVSYVLEPDTASTALLKIIHSERDNSNTETYRSTVTFRMTPTGTLTRISESGVQGSTSITLTF
jgi:hypothetical protein